MPVPMTTAAPAATAALPDPFPKAERIAGSLTGTCVPATNIISAKPMLASRLKVGSAGSTSASPVRPIRTPASNSPRTTGKLQRTGSASRGPARATTAISARDRKVTARWRRRAPSSHVLSPWNETSPTRARFPCRRALTVVDARWTRRGYSCAFQLIHRVRGYSPRRQDRPAVDVRRMRGPGKESVGDGSGGSRLHAAGQRLAGDPVDRHDPDFVDDGLAGFGGVCVGPLTLGPRLRPLVRLAGGPRRSGPDGGREEAGEGRHCGGSGGRTAGQDQCGAGRRRGQRAGRIPGCVRQLTRRGLSGRWRE